MRAGLVGLTAAVVLTSPADACHRFARWAYPYPQRCTVIAQAADVKMPDIGPGEKIFQTKLPRFTLSDTDTIILRLPPGTGDEEGRAQAIQILREVMGR